MTTAWEWVGQGAQHGTTILALHQTAGRGRFHRNWHSNIDESLTMSIIIQTEAAVAKKLSMIASLGVITGIEHMAGLRPTIKWPNDIQWNGRKLCGILIESRVNTNGESTIVIGIGLNLALNLDRYPEIADSTISLSDLTRKPVSTGDCLIQVLSGVDYHYERAIEGINPVEDWKSACNTIGKSVVAVGAKGLVEGIAESIDQDGNLILQTANGHILSLSSEEISLKHAQ